MIFVLATKAEKGKAKEELRGALIVVADCAVRTLVSVLSIVTYKIIDPHSLYYFLDRPFLSVST